MKIKNTTILIFLSYLFFFTEAAFAITVQEFKLICNASNTEKISCDEHPMINAYIGGGLDLVASLDEGTKYLGKLYCEQPETLFDVKTIIRFIERSKQEYDNQNAMFRLVAYLEQHSNC